MELGRNSHLVTEAETLCFYFLFLVGVVCSMASLKFAFVNDTTAQPAQGPVFMPLHSLLWYTVATFKLRLWHLLRGAKYFLGPEKAGKRRHCGLACIMIISYRQKELTSKGSYTILKIKQ